MSFQTIWTLIRENFLVKLFAIPVLYAMPLMTLSGSLDLLITFPKRERNVATLSSLKWLASLTLSVFSESFKPANKLHY